jgi:uncharacterized membrane protein
METFSYGLWFTVRYVHVASMTVLAGGALTMCTLCLASTTPVEAEPAWAAAPAYEWTFWSIIGVIVATGVSNLGLKGEGLMGPQTTWGSALSVKLGLVLLLIAVSLLRSDFVIRCAMATHRRATARARALLATLYGLTLALVLAALWIGLGLAHGRY